MIYIVFDSCELCYQTFDERIDRLFLHEYDSFKYLYKLANYISTNDYDYCNGIKFVYNFSSIDSWSLQLVFKVSF